MCGIAGFYAFKEQRPERDLLKRLWAAQAARGTDAAGVAYVKGEALSLIKKAQPSPQLAHALGDTEWAAIEQSPLALFHARAATQGSPANNENNHPVVSHGWVITHNGRVLNDHALAAHYKITTRPEVDTVAIAWALGQGNDTAQSLSHLSVLLGSATFAGVRQDAIRTLILARLSGPDLLLHYDQDKRILYWSSDPKGIFQTKRRLLGGLEYTTLSALPARTALVLTPTQVFRYEIPYRPFHTHFPLPPLGVVSPPPPNRTLPSLSTPSIPPPPNSVVEGAGNGFRDWLLVGSPIYQFPNKESVQVETQESYHRLGKPAPELTPKRLTLVASPAPLPAYKKLRTPYGEWRTRRAGCTFRPTPSVRHFWQRDLAPAIGMEVSLPATPELQEAIDGTMRLESVRVSYSGVTASLLLCPWCGILSRSTTWTVGWRNRCGWCRVQSFLP